MERDQFGSIMWPEEFKSLGLKTVPQLFRSCVESGTVNQHIGGYDDLVDFDLDGGLKSDE